jgi:hypothetical protein
MFSQYLAILRYLNSKLHHLQFNSKMFKPNQFLLYSEHCLLKFNLSQLSTATTSRIRQNRPEFLPDLSRALPTPKNNDSPHCSICSARIIHTALQICLCQLRRTSRMKLPGKAVAHCPDILGVWQFVPWPGALQSPGIGSPSGVPHEQPWLTQHNYKSVSEGVKLNVRTWAYFCNKVAVGALRCIWRKTDSTCIFVGAALWINYRRKVSQNKDKE